MKTADPLPLLDVRRVDFEVLLAKDGQEPRVAERRAQQQQRLRPLQFGRAQQKAEKHPLLGAIEPHELRVLVKVHKLRAQSANGRGRGRERGEWSEVVG